MLADRNRDGLAAQFVPEFAELKKQYGIQQFQFHLAPATAFFRVHQPAKFDDDLSSFRKTVVETNTTLKPAVGLEGGVGGIGIRGVVPSVQQRQARGIGGVRPWLRRAVRQ